MGDSWCSTISVEWWSFTVGVHDLLYAWVELRGRHSASTCSEYLLSDGGSGKTSDTTGLAYKQLKLNRMLKTIKRLLRPLFLLFIFDLWRFFNASLVPDECRWRSPSLLRPTYQTTSIQPTHRPSASNNVVGILDDYTGAHMWRVKTPFCTLSQQKPERRWTTNCIQECLVGQRVLFDCHWKVNLGWSGHIFPLKQRGKRRKRNKECIG